MNMLINFFTKLKLLVNDCGYASTIEYEMVRDRLMYGANSQNVLEKFISRSSDLNLKSAINIAQKSATAQFKKINDDPVSVDGIKSRK